MIANDHADDWLRRRLGLPPDDSFEALQLAGFERIRAYHALVLSASAGQFVDPDELHNAGAAIGRSPCRVLRDVQTARAAWLAWQRSVEAT